MQVRCMKKDIELIIKKAADIINSADINGIKFEEKGLANYVTETDIKVQKFLSRELKNIIPESNIIGEEAKDNKYILDKPTWIIDPIDGTTNFMYGYNHSAISAALCISGKLKYGFVYNPSSKEMFFAEDGKGAFLNGNEIRVSENKTLGTSLIGFGTSPYEKDKGLKTLDIIKTVYLKSRDIRRSGSAALDICYTACGRTDGFFEMTLQPWDFSAASLILKESGGKITDWKGNSINILKKESILATNGIIHNRLLELLERENRDE